MFPGRVFVILNGCLIFLVINQFHNGLAEEPEAGAGAAADADATGPCLCSVEKNGEYCGTQLNEMNQDNRCPKKMFYCGDSNRNKDAVILVDCQPGQECDQTSFFSNACLKDIECECPKGLSRGQTYCGSMLEGRHCSPNVTFTCPYLSMIFHPSPVDACLFGCKDGQCIPETTTTEK